MARTKRYKALRKKRLRELIKNRDSFNQHLSTLPLEVLHQSLDLLDNVADLGRVSLVCRNWRDVVYSHDAWWEKAFLRDYSEHNAEEYKTLPSWRQKYM